MTAHVSYPFLAAGLLLLAWMFTGVVVAAGWSALRGHRAAVLAAVAAGFAAVVLAYAGAVLW